jgi:metallo-beta-lactamase family protein
MVNHGEPDAAATLAARLGELGHRALMPRLDETWVLTRTSAEPAPRDSARLATGQATRPDWHNERAAFLVALNEALQGLAGDAEREALLDRLTAALPPDR